MDFRDTPAEAALREDIRQWLRDNLPPGWGSTAREPEEEAARFATLPNFGSGRISRLGTSLRRGISQPQSKCR